MDRGRHGEGSHLGLWASRFGVYSLSLLSTYLLLRQAPSASESTPFGDFRGFFSYDQLAYAGIASTAATGNFAAVEPFTETGTSYYPSAWYKLLGALAYAFDVGIPAVWTIAGLTVLAAMVISLGLITQRVSGRLWTVLLVGPALWIGPLALAVGSSWYLKLQSHAVLWGPYGMLFALNAEMIALSLGLIALCLLLYSVYAGTRRSRLWLVGIAGALVGLLANIQTYAFLLIAAFVAAWAASVGIAMAEKPVRRQLLLASLGIILLVGVSGQAITALNSSLILFGLLLTAAIPGASVLIRRQPLVAMTGGVTAAAFALPQVLLYLTGFITQAPFLTYRQVQSGDLGIDVLSFLVATLPIALWALLIARTTWKSSLPGPMKAVIPAAFTVLVLMSFNNVWGFSQEPYRLWIVSVAATSLLLVPLTGFALTDGKALTSLRAHVPLAVLALSAVFLSWWNVGGFRTYVSEEGSIPFGSARITALGAVAKDQGGLITTDPCVDPMETKIVSRSRIAYYAQGLAWPDNREAIDALLESRGQGILDPDLMRQAGVTYLVTDSACPAAWQSLTDRNFSAVQTEKYETGTGPAEMVLWLLR